MAYRNVAPKNVFEPTPSQIKKQCAEIRKTWTDEEYSKRSKHLMAKPVEMFIWADSISDQLAVV